NVTLRCGFRGRSAALTASTLPRRKSSNEIKTSRFMRNHLMRQKGRGWDGKGRGPENLGITKVARRPSSLDLLLSNRRTKLTPADTAHSSARAHSRRGGSATR